MKLTSEQKPETLEQYFDRSDTPARSSPVGNTMVRILVKYPGISFEKARAKAHELLNTSAKARIYRGPVVLSAEELAKSKNRLKQVFRRPGKEKALSKITIPSDSRSLVDTQSEVLRRSGLRIPAGR